MPTLGDVILDGDEHEIMRRIQSLAASLPAWTCRRCEEEFVMCAEPRSGLCATCSSAVDAERGRFRSPRPALSRFEALVAVGCPRRYADVEFREPSWRHWPKAASWAGDPWLLVFEGTIESGKSTAATEVFYRLLERFHAASWVSFGPLIEALYGNMGKERQAKAYASLEADLLLLDDFGWNANGGTWEKVKEVVIDPRFNDYKPTILTTNHDITSVPMPALVRRLTEECLLVGCTKDPGR